MRQVFASFAAVLFLVCAPSAAVAQTAAQNPVTVQLGQSLTLAPDPDGAFRVIAQSNNATGLSDFEQSTANALAQSSDASGPNAARVAGPPDAASQEAVPGQIQLRLVRIEGDAVVLAIDNGLDQALAYRATIWRGLQSMPTDVCLVLPHLHGYEHWPYEFDSIVLTDLRLLPWHDGDPLTCQ